MDDQSDPNEVRLRAVDSAMLTPFVRHMLDSDTLLVRTWSYEPMHGGAGGGHQDTYLYRFSGQADDPGSNIKWTMVLKVLRTREGEALDSPQYWKREAELAQSGLLDELPGGFFAPRFFGVIDYPGEAVWIWMEHVESVLDQSWPLSHYALIGRHLGQFNGAYLVKRPIPSEPWLSKRWLHKQAQILELFMPYRLDAVAHPQIKPGYSSHSNEQLRRLWKDCDLFCDQMDLLPQTLCHLDAFRRNLIPRCGSDGQFETVAVDWAHIGIAAVGADIAIAVIVGLMTMDLLAGELAEVDHIIFDAYLVGLSDMGWSGDPDQVRLGYTLSAAIKYLETGTTVCMLMNDDLRPGLEQFTGYPAAEIVKQYGEGDRFVYKLVEEARALMRRSDIWQDD